MKKLIIISLILGCSGGAFAKDYACSSIRSHRDYKGEGFRVADDFVSGLLKSNKGEECWCLETSKRGDLLHPIGKAVGGDSCEKSCPIRCK